MLISIRYAKNFGNNSLYYRARDVNGNYYNFLSKEFISTETDSCKLYLSENQDSDEWESLYSLEVPYLNIVEYVQEIVFSQDGSVAASGVFSSQKAPTILSNAGYSIRPADLEPPAATNGGFLYYTSSAVTAPPSATDGGFL